MTLHFNYFPQHHHRNACIEIPPTPHEDSHECLDFHAEQRLHKFRKYEAIFQEFKRLKIFNQINRQNHVNYIVS